MKIVTILGAGMAACPMSCRARCRPDCFTPLKNLLPSRSAFLLVTPEVVKWNLASEILSSPETSNLHVLLDSQLPAVNSHFSALLSSLHQNETGALLPWAVPFLDITGTPQRASSTCVSPQARALKGCWWRKGRRKAFLSDGTYSGLLFFSSSESEFWWWIQLLSLFRVVRTFICLMILLRSSSVGVITRSRRGRGRREEKGCWEGAKLQCQQVSCWQTLDSREHRSPISQRCKHFMSILLLPMKDENKLSSKIQDQFTPAPLMRHLFYRDSYSFSILLSGDCLTLMSYFLPGKPKTFSGWSNHIFTRQCISSGISHQISSSKEHFFGLWERMISLERETEPMAGGQAIKYINSAFFGVLSENARECLIKWKQQQQTQQ